jgi:protein TonB
MIQPSVDTKASLRGAITMGAGSDRDVIPLVRINPEYPMRARQRGVEGWVLIQFTISPAGTVKDARVVDADPPNIFDDSAIKAVNRWRYNPKIEEGVAVERRGVQVVLEFKLEG